MLGELDLILPGGNKKAALPVMMEARPGGEEGDRSALEGSGPDLGWPLDWRLAV